KKVTDQERMRELKKISKACQIKLKDNKGNPESIQKINKEMMDCSMELMKHSFKPMIYTFIPIIILFWWIKDVYTGVLSGWIWWYIGASILSSIIFRKVFDVV
ncbi:MAG: EMC3/TMCO1 family protein, partial [Nanoarchaeota archaeon]